MTATKQCFQTRFVILNAVKNPSEFGPLLLGSEEPPTGFFATLRMTGFECSKGGENTP
jgi:hypothetical protein